MADQKNGLFRTPAQNNLNLEQKNRAKAIAAENYS